MSVEPSEMFKVLGVETRVKIKDYRKLFKLGICYKRVLTKAIRTIIKDRISKRGNIMFVTPIYYLFYYYYFSGRTGMF